MSILRALGLLLIGAIVAAGQHLDAGPQAPGEKTSENCSVEGVVVKSTSGEGVKRATVQLTPIGGLGRQPYSTSTENNGRFIFRDIPPGRYVINATVNGYSQFPSPMRKGDPRVKILELTPGMNMRGIDLRLIPPGVITGTVYEEDGEPVTLAQVRALRVVGSGAHRQVSEAGSGQTNDLGGYRIWGLRPGKYLVAADYKPPENNPGQQSEEVYLPTFHPSTPDASQAIAVEVDPGLEASGIDVDLRQAHAVTIRGRVMVDNPVKSLRGIYLSLTPRAAAGGGFSFSNYGGQVQNDAGDFEIRGVPPGSYNLSGFWSEGKRTLYGKVPVDVSSASLEGVNFVLGSPLTIAGRIRVEGGSPFDLTRLGVGLLASDKSMGSGSAEIKPDGTFVVPNVYEGNYRLRISGFPEAYYVKSAREGGSEVLAAGLTVSRSTPPKPLEIVISPHGGRVDGSVLHDDHPVDEAWVVLVPDPPSRDREDMYSAKATDQYGRFTLLGLPPGDFKLFAWEPVPGTNYNDPDFFESSEDRGTSVHITEGQAQTVQLELITAEEQLP